MYLSQSTKDVLSAAIHDSKVKIYSNPLHYKPIEFVGTDESYEPGELRADSFGRVLCMFEHVPEDKKKYIAVDLLYIAARIGYEFDITVHSFVKIW